MSSRKFFIYFFLANLLLALGFVYVSSWGAFKWLANYTLHERYVKIPNLYSLNLQQALLLLKKEGLEYDIDTSRYDPIYTPYKILTYAPEAGFYVKPGRHIFIRANAGGFKPIKLPEGILQNNERIAIAKLSKNNILVRKVSYIPSIYKGIILKILYADNEIYSGNLLPYKATVDLFIGRDYEKNVPVPNLIGMDLISAKKKIQEKNFLLGNVIYDYPEKKEQAYVYRQDPPPIHLYDEGKALNIWLSDIPKSQLDSLILDPNYKKELLSPYVDSLIEERDHLIPPEEGASN